MRSSHRTSNSPPLGVSALSNSRRSTRPPSGSRTSITQPPRILMPSTAGFSAVWPVPSQRTLTTRSTSAPGSVRGPCARRAGLPGVCPSSSSPGSLSERCRLVWQARCRAGAAATCRKWLGHGARLRGPSGTLHVRGSPRFAGPVNSAAAHAYAPAQILKDPRGGDKGHPRVRRQRPREDSVTWVNGIEGAAHVHWHR